LKKKMRMKKEKTSKLVGRIIQTAALGEEHKIRGVLSKCQDMEVVVNGFLRNSLFSLIPVSSK
jgi:hypothetical protein